MRFIAFIPAIIKRFNRILFFIIYPQTGYKGYDLNVTLLLLDIQLVLARIL